jgi:hypothetical protein
MGKRIENQGKARCVVDPFKTLPHAAFVDVQFANHFDEMGRSLNYGVKFVTVTWTSAALGRELDATKEVETTCWEPGVGYEGTRLKIMFVVVQMVDYHVYHLCSHRKCGFGPITLVLRVVLDEI